MLISPYVHMVGYGLCILALSCICTNACSTSQELLGHYLLMLLLSQELVAVDDANSKGARLGLNRRFHLVESLFELKGER